MQSNDSKMLKDGYKLTVTPPEGRQEKKVVGRRRAPSDTNGEILREKSRNLARAGTTSEQLRRVQELASEKHDKIQEEEESIMAARAYAQRMVTQEQLRRIGEDADQKCQARRESESERQRNIELAVSLAEQERQRRMKEDKRSVFKQRETLPSIADESGFQFQHMSLGSPLPTTMPTTSPFAPYSQSPSSPSSGSSLSPTHGDISPLGVSNLPVTTLPPIPASSPLFRAQSSSPEPAPPARKVRKTRTRTRSTNPIPRPDSPKMRRRARKNSRERQRRVELNDQFEKLSAMLSVDRKGKLRKTSILLEAISVIGTLRSENSRLRAQQQQAVPAIAVGGNTNNGTSNKRSRVRPRSGSSQYPRPSTYRSTSSNSPPSASFPSPRSSSPIPSGDGMLDDLLPPDLSTLPIKRSQSYGNSSLNSHTRSVSASPSTLNGHPYPLSPNYSTSRSQPPSPMGFPYPLSHSYTGDRLPPFPEAQTIPIPPLVDSALLNLDIDTNPSQGDITPFLLSPTSFSSSLSPSAGNGRPGQGSSTYVAPSPVSSVASTISSASDTPQPHSGRIPRSLTEDSNFSSLKNLHSINHEFDSHHFLNTDWIGAKCSMDFEDPSSTTSHLPLLKLELEQPTIPIPLTDMIDDSVDSPRTIKTESPSSFSNGLGTPKNQSTHEIDNEMETWAEELTSFDPKSTQSGGHHGNLLLSSHDTTTFDWPSIDSTSSSTQPQSQAVRKLTV